MAIKSNQLAAQQRAEAFFDIYMMLGSERSLTKLQTILADGGLEISLNTLKTYSSDHNWQLRIQEAQKIAQTQQGTKEVGIISEMNDRQSNLGKAMQLLSSRGIREAAGNLSQLTVRDSVSLADVGVKLERLARGEATTRQEVANQMISPVIYNIVNMFQQINVYDDRDERMREFAKGCDAILAQTVGPLVEEG